MKRIALTTLLAIALLDCFLAYSGQYLASQVRQFGSDRHILLPGFSLITLTIPPWFYLFAVVAVVIAILGLTHKLSDCWLVYTAVVLLFVDIAALLLMLWGVGVIMFPAYERVA